MAGEVSKDITNAPAPAGRTWSRPTTRASSTSTTPTTIAQHMHNCDLVNLEDMLQNGTVISGTLIERPHSFSTACNIATQIIAQVASCQYGGQSISLTHLAPFVRGQPPEDPPVRCCRRSMRWASRPTPISITEVVEEPSARRDPPRRADHPVPGGHAHDHQRPGAVRHRLHVPQRGAQRSRRSATSP